jgi:hypothetical protein
MDTHEPPEGRAMNLPAIPNPNPKIIMTATGIEFRSDLSHKEWDELGRTLIPCAEIIAFMLGDWINYGSRAYGSKYKEALDATNIPCKTLRNYASVARRVSYSFRVPGLGFEHHSAVARLESHAQKYWLGLAKEHNLSVRRLRKSIQAGRLVSEEELEDGTDTTPLNHVTLINRLVRWWTSETCKVPLEQWNEEWRMKLKRDFEQIMEIYRQL